MTTSLAERGLLARDAKLETVAEGFKYTEGPVWDVRKDMLLFHDILLNTRYRWSEKEGAAEDARPTDFANGMAFDPVGRLLICTVYGLHRRYLDGTTTVVASHYQGKELNSPNDVIVRSNGDIYFTDPRYGRIPVYGVERPQELPFQGLYRVRAADQELELLSDDFEDPNGLAFSPGESRLYVDDTGRANIRVFDVDREGGISGDSVFVQSLGPALDIDDVRRNSFEAGYVDGLRCDELGNVYVTGPGGIWVYDPEGEHLGVIELPEPVANLAWGGPELCTLFFAGRFAIHRLRTEVRGAAVPGHRVASTERSDTVAPQ